MSNMPQSPFIPSSADVEPAEALPVEVSGRDHYPAGSAAPIEDDFSCIGEIFIGAGKLIDPDEHRFVLNEQAFMDAIDEPPLFLRRA